MVGPVTETSVSQPLPCGLSQGHVSLVRSFLVVPRAASGCLINDAIRSSVRSAIVNPLSGGVYTPSAEWGEEQHNLWGGWEEPPVVAGPGLQLRGGHTAVERKHPGLRNDSDFPRPQLVPSRLMTSMSF